jgi:thiamine-phosphate pyrophosphorylase
MSDSASRLRLAIAAAKLAWNSPLPALLLLTDDKRLPDPVAAAQALPHGSMVIVRCRDPARRKALTTALKRLDLIVLVAGDATLARTADGIHLSEARAGEAAALRARGFGLITVAAHSLAALRGAAFADAAILSPVFPTASHPGRAALGPLRAAAIAHLSPIPVYALGGISAANAARLTGFCGIAAIGALAV